MKIKDSSVNLIGVCGEIFYAAIVVEQVLHDDYGAELVITSAHDGKHMNGSLHYKGQAIDVRTWAIKGRETEVIAKLKTKLGPNYDIVVESDHIHLEYDPK